MEQELLGELFGVEIHRPLQADEIRAMMKAKQALVVYLVENKKLPLHKIYFQLDDQIYLFANTLPDSEASRFYELLREESTEFNQKYPVQKSDYMQQDEQDNISLSIEGMETKRWAVWTPAHWVILAACIILCFLWFKLR